MWDKDTYNFMEFVRIKCEMIEEAESVWSEMPEGSLVVRNEDGKPQYYWQYMKNNTRKLIYLNKTTEATLIKKLEIKKNTKRMRKDVVKWKNILLKLKPAIAQVLSEYTPLAIPDSKIYYSEKNGYLDELKEKTLHGEFVRSRAEALLADRLFYMKIPYRYEKALSINGIILYPDFTVTNPLTGQDVYVEFLGMSTPSYNETWQKKLKLYKASGLYPSDRLLIIPEGQRSDAELIFSKMFTLKRYSNMLNFLKITL